MRTYDLNTSETTALPSSSLSAPVARFLPKPLIQARAAVFDPLNCLDINMTARRTLFGILAFFNLSNPNKEVFASRDVLRAESMLSSMSTLYRGLSDLQTKGYIERRQVRKYNRKEFGQYHISQIFLSEKARVLLGLNGVIHNPRSTKMEDGIQDKELTKNKQSLQNTAGEPDSSKKNRIDRATHLPIDLLPLLNLGVEKSAICHLMKLARSSCKMLSDVVKVVAHNIAHMKGREVVAYLTKMIAKNLDYSWLAKDRLAQSEKLRAEDDAKAKLQALDSRYDGYTVFSKDGRTLGIFVASKATNGTHLVQSTSGSIPINLTFARAWANGNIHMRPPVDLFRNNCSSGDWWDADDKDNNAF